MTADPARILSTGSSAPGLLKELVRAAREEAPSPAQLEHMEARLMGLAVAPAAAAAAAGVKAAVVWTWLAVAAVGTGVTGGVLWYAHAAPRPLARVATPAPVAAVPAPETQPEALSTPLPAPKPASPRVRPAPPAESILLGDAFQALRSGDASQALALAQQHQRVYPHGSMEEEREAIEIEALTQLGRSGEARRRLTAFEARHPRSGYAWRLEALVSP
jgi:hypothetical protein